MNLVDAIREIINPDVILEINTGEKILTLKEDSLDSSIRKLYIQNIPENTIAFTLDYQPKQDKKCYQQLSCYLHKSNDKGINKGCDLLLFTPYKKDFIILIIDLKSKRIKKESIEKQLHNSELYIRYLMTMVENYYFINTNSIKYKKVIINTKERKPSSKRGTYQPNNKPYLKEPFYIETVEVNQKKEAYIYLNQLLK